MPRRLHQVFADAGDFVVDVLVQRVDVRRNAVVQVDADGDGAHVEVLVGHHADGFEDFVGMDLGHLGVSLSISVGCRGADCLKTGLDFQPDIHTFLCVFGCFPHFIIKYVGIFFD